MSALALCLFLILASSETAHAQNDTRLYTPPKFKLYELPSGSTFKPGDVITNRWAPIDADNTVVLEYTTDGGANWVEVMTQTKLDTSYKWRIPNITCDPCQLRLRQIGGMLGPGLIVDSFAVATARSQVRDIVIGDRGSLMAVQFLDSIYIIDFQSGEFLGTLRHPTFINGVSSLSIVAFSQPRFALNDSLLIVGMKFERAGVNVQTETVLVWDLTTMELVHTVPGSILDLPITPYDQSYRSAAMDPSGRYLLLAGDDRTKIWSIEDNRLVDSLPMRLTQSAEYSPDGRYIAVASLGSLVLWDVESTDTVFTVQGYFDRVEFSNDGSWLLVTPSFEPYNPDSLKRSVLILDVPSGDTVYYNREFRNTRTASMGRPLNRLLLPLNVTYSGLVRELDSSQSSGLSFDWYNPILNGGFDYDLDPTGAYVLGYSFLGVAYKVDLTVFPFDTLNTPFTISNAALLPLVINPFVGTVELGRSGDTVINGFVHNRGTIPVPVQQVRLASGSVEEFEIISGAGPYTVEPGTTASVGIRFTPAEEGGRFAVIEVVTDFGIVPSDITGYAIRNTNGVENETGESIADDGLRLTISPNPASELLDINYRTSRTGRLTLRMYDPAGRLELVIDLGPTAPGSHQANVDVSSLRSGVYYVKIEVDGVATGEHAVIVR